jgi:hypothetical protein
LRREAHLRRGSSVDSRRNTPLVDFYVERHTLVNGEVTQIFHQSSTTVSQVEAVRAHSVRVRAQPLRRFSGSTCPFQGDFRDSPPTHLRGRKDMCIKSLIHQSKPQRRYTSLQYKSEEKDKASYWASVHWKRKVPGRDLIQAM